MDRTYKSSNVILEAVGKHFFKGILSGWDFLLNSSHHYTQCDFFSILTSVAVK